MLKKKKLFKIKFNKIFISINTRIESFFNYFTNFKHLKIKKKIKFNTIDKRIFISIGSIVILILSYFLMPVLYNEKIVKILLENQISKKHGLEVKFENPINYSLFPKPHFYTKNTVINYNDGNLAKSKFLKVYISIKNLFFLKDLKIHNIIFKKTDFIININNYSFFKNILDSNKNHQAINFTGSKLFYTDLNDDMKFLVDIEELNFLHNDNFAQELNTKLKIFNTQFKLNITNNFNKKITFAKLNSHQLRLNIENSFDYNKKSKKGLLDFKVINKSKKLNYTLHDNSLSFSTDKKQFLGSIDFKPFYLKSDLNFNQVDIVKILENNSLLINLANSEIFNNKNLNANINFFIDKIRRINHLDNLILRTYFEEGNILLKDSSARWNDSIIIYLDDAQVFNENNNSIIAGSVSFNFTDIDNFYKQYQIKKAYRKKIKKIRLDFLLDINEKKIEFDNLKIDGNSNKTADKFVNNFNLKKKNIFNKIVFKNLIKEFFGNV
tara:strand:+ start:390 stop:1877 length:1488 start_codon:yes stop_codon:yes gene_type:complete